VVGAGTDLKIVPSSSPLGRSPIKTAKGRDGKVVIFSTLLSGCKERKGKKRKGTKIGTG
jgi:hypothetical protein